MYREDRFVMSHRPYAVDMSSLRPKYQHDSKLYGNFFMLSAVWFRRKNGITAACVGELWDSQRVHPQNALDFLERHGDGRYGGDCLARWDGASFWCAGQDPEENTRHLELLRTVLDAYHASPKAPELSERWDCWWRF